MEAQKPMKQYDLVVIGFGKAGKTLAGFFANNGQKVALIEKDKKRYGGTCINVACIPTKTLVYQAERANLIPPDYEARNKYYLESIKRKDDVTSLLREKNYHKLLDNPNVTIYDGVGSFVNEKVIRVTLEKGYEEIEGKNILINTGSTAVMPNIEGVKTSKNVYYSETLLDKHSLPKKMIVIGGGYIGLEFASMYQLFGSDVTIIQDGLDFIPREDEDIAKAVYDSLIKRGIKIIKGAKITKIEDNNKESTVTYIVNNKEEEIKGDAILVATGRRANIDELNLSNAKIELTPRGAIKVDERLRTNVPHIYAAGDVAGGLQFTYISLDDSRIIKDDLLGSNKRTSANRGEVPYSVFITPCFSRVGLSEKEAKDKGYQIMVGKIPASTIPKTHVINETEGLLKVIIDAKTHLILGAHLFCSSSYEVINIIKLAIDQKIPYEVLRDNIYTHPTISEGLNDLFQSVK
jgi:pyruvate/2-oxoglutarate dehydrogenase complex dihydrolipoamide dehydrogenase (E3) component